MPLSLTEQTHELFSQTFGGEPEILALAPGRVNLIGEHTDYNDGYVLPMAVDLGIAIAGRKRKDSKILLYSEDYQEQEEFTLNTIRHDISRPWANYFKGVAFLMKENGVPLGGCEAVLKGDLPQGGGLSSSAALEVVSAVFLNKLFGGDLEDLDLIRLAQKAENEFVGVQCGIMDQFASHLGKKGHALFIDCRSLEHDWVPVPAGLKAVVFNTGIKRELASSDYNERRRQCQEGVRQFAKFMPGLKSLRDLSLRSLEQFQGDVEPLPLKRCRHVVMENQRVLDTVEALKNNNAEKLKTLFRESHESLRDDYEVSCHELDTLVALAQEHPLQKGSRMTGAGFGGCTVHLVSGDEKALRDFVAFVSEGYQRRIGRKPEHYVFSPSPGAKFLNQ
jgi:galactokinase